MFKNIDKKIKWLAKFFVWWPIIGGAITLIISIGMLIVASTKGETAVKLAFATMSVYAVYYVIVVLVTWIVSWSIYGFGHLLSLAEKQANHLEKIENQLDYIIRQGAEFNINNTNNFESVSNENVKCPQCGEPIAQGDQFCANCGKRLN